MLILRDEQIEALERDRLARFRRFARKHLEKHFAPELVGRSQQEIEAIIRRGIRLGRTYGVREEWAWLKLIDLLVVFGADFESRPDFGWVRDILRDRRVGSPERRVRLLMREALAHLRRHERPASVLD